MFRRSRLNVRPNVKPGGRGSSQTSKEDDKTHTSDQQLSPERKASSEKDASESPDVLSVPPTPLPNPSIGQEERDDPDEQQENVPLSKNEKNDKTGEAGANSKSSVAPLQRRKRFSTTPNLAKPRSTSASAQQSSSVTPKSLPQQQSPLTSETNAASIQDNTPLSQTATTEKQLTKSPEKRKPSSGQHTKLPEKKTPIPQVPQFSPVKKPVHKDPAVATNSTRAPMTRKILSSPLKERVTPSSTPTKGTVPSPNVSPARPKAAKIPSDLERLRKARKLREMLKEELRKEKKAHRETIPIWETSNPPERTKMTMRDFIYYLPDTNPMLSSLEEKRPSFPVLTKEPEVETTNAPANEDEDEESDDAVLGPRVKVAEDGSIIIDEESLTVEVLRMKGPNVVEDNDPIFERGSQTTYSSFRKSTHTKPWSNKETDLFFLAISMVGTDFSMIGQLFPKRTRVEIKNKFKREEKLNSWRIDKAFKEKKPLDLEFFGELLTRVLEAEAKRKREKNGRNKSQAPRKSSTTKRNRKGKKLRQVESDPDDPDPVEGADTELTEADSNAVVEGTEASCSVEGQEVAQKKETISKPFLTKRKQKKKNAAEPAEKETAEEPPQEDSDSQKPKRKVRHRKKRIQKASASVSDEEGNVGEKIAEGEDDCHMVSGEISSNQGTSEDKQPSQTKRKKKSIDKNKSLRDQESVASSETTPPVTTENSNKSQHVRLQKSKPNLKGIAKRRAGGKGSEQTASEAIAPYDDQNNDKSDKVKEASLQDHDPLHEEPTEIMNKEVSEKQNLLRRAGGKGSEQTASEANAPYDDQNNDKSDKVKEVSVQDHDPLHEEPTEIMNKEVSEKDVSSAPMPETIEVDKAIAEEISPSKAQDSDTESRSVEKPSSQEEPRTKSGQAVRSRFQKPKPNLGRAIVKKDLPSHERKTVAIQEKEATELSPIIPITKASEASEKTGSDAYFALESKAQSPVAVPVSSDSVESERQGVTDSDTEISRRGSWDSDKVQRSERTSECDSQDEQEELKLGAIQENIMSKPTRSGRQPKPTAFYKSPAEQKPSTTSTLLSEGENEGKGKCRSARSQKAKPKVSKGLGKKEVQTKNAGKGQGTTKMTLVTLRASQEDDDDDEEPEVEEEDDIYSINPEEVNKAPAFVPISLRSPEPVQTQVEETMEELEIAVNVSDKNYDSETEQSLPELPDKSGPCQSCTLVSEEDYHSTTADQIELFVEVIEIASEETVPEEDHCNAEPSDGLQNAPDTDVSCVDQKNLEQESVLGSDPPSLHIVVCDTVPNVSDVHTESSRLDEQNVPTEKDLKDGLDLQEPPLPKEDSTNASCSSSLIEESDGSQTNRAMGRCRFLKPKPNLSKTTSRSRAKKLSCSVTESREVQSSVEPSGTTLQKAKHGNKTEMNLDECLQLRLVTAEGDKQNITMEQVPAEQPNDKVSISEEQDKDVGDEEQMRRTEHLDDVTEHLGERVPPAHDQLQTTNQSQEAQARFSSDTYFTQSTLTLCQTADTRLSVEAPEATAEVSYFGYSQKIDVIEAQNIDHQETFATSEENLENLMAIGSPKEETFILTLVAIPASSLTEYDASSASFIPVSEDTLTVAEPVVPSSMENVEVTESVSSEPLMEAPAVPTVSESVPLIKSLQQQWSLNKPTSNIGQMDRKRKAHSLIDDQDASVAKKSLTIPSTDERSREYALQTEETTSSNLATCISPEDCPATSTTGILSNYDVAQMSLPSESSESFTSTALDNVVASIPVEEAVATHSISADEMKKSASVIRRGKLTVKPNFSTKRATSNSETSLSAGNKNTLKLSRTPRNTPSPRVSEKSLQAEPACNSSVVMNSAQQEPESVYHNHGQTDAPETAAATESVHSSTDTTDTDASTAADTNTGTAADTVASTVAEQSEMSVQNTVPTSSTSLTRPGRKPRGFLSFISKKSSECESETKTQRTKCQKPRMSLPRFAGKRPIPSGEDAEETKASSSPPAKRKSCEKPSGSQPDTRTAPTKVICNSSLQSWQSESYTEEACCAVEQDTEQTLPTRVAEYFFSDIFTEVDEQE
ncbi:transcription factor TFIIIB component B'' homolog isoform X2 [Heptranchias perlo]|uniref:transcription factor TFIIIB component B'' homolog isoform X2 n=1 Tax=Heptranchias perlo TaxID=212740 RepID=UPI00355945F5